MRKATAVSFLLVLTLIPSFASAMPQGSTPPQAPAPQDRSAQHAVDGNWVFFMDSQMGQVTGQVVLKADGEKLTGTFTLDTGRVLQIEDGRIKGNELTFTLNRERPSGGVMSYHMAGKLDGDSITGTAGADMGGQTIELPWTMTRKK